MQQGQLIATEPELFEFRRDFQRDGTRKACDVTMDNGRLNLFLQDTRSNRRKVGNNSPAGLTTLIQFRLGQSQCATTAKWTSSSWWGVLISHYDGRRSNNGRAKKEGVQEPASVVLVVVGVVWIGHRFSETNVLPPLASNFHIYLRSHQLFRDSQDKLRYAWELRFYDFFNTVCPVGPQQCPLLLVEASRSDQQAKNTDTQCTSNLRILIHIFIHANICRTKVIQ